MSEATQLCLTLCDPVGCSPPGSSVHGIFQARVLEWFAISFSRGSSRLRDLTQVSRTEADALPCELPGKIRKMQELGFNPWVRKIPWRRKGQPTPVSLLGKSHVERRLAGCSPCSGKELDTTKHPHMQQPQHAPQHKEGNSHDYHTDYSHEIK